MEKKSSRIQLKPLKAADESHINKLIDSISGIAKCDLSAFNQIRDFFFQLSYSDYERLSQKYNNRFSLIIFTIFKASSAQLKDPDQKIHKYKTAFLSLMGFLNFKLLNSKTTKELLDLLNKQIIESSYEDLSHILRIIRLSFSIRDAEYLKLIPALKNRLFEILNSFENINMQTLTLAISLLGMISAQIHSLVPIIPVLEKILKYEYPNRLPLQNLISIFALQFKIATIIPTTGNNSPIIPAIIRILLKTPPSISTIIESSVEILVSYFQKDPEKRIESVMPFFPLLLNFQLLTSENFRPYLFMIQYIFEQLQKTQKVNDELLLKFVKYIASILHFRKATFTQCSTYFSNIYHVIHLPTAQSQFRNILLSLFIFSFDVGFVEIEQQIVRMMDMMSSQRELLCAFNALLIVGEYYYRLLKFLIDTVKIVNRCDLLKDKPFLAQIASPLPKIDFNQLVELLVRSLIILMKYREALQRSIQMVRFTEPSKNSQDHYKLCNQNLKAVRTYDRARKFHFNSAQELINCVSLVPPFYALQIWDTFFERFFSSANNFALDTCTFRVVIADTRVFPTFFTSVTSFICKKLKSGNKLTNFLKSMQTIFEKLSIKPSSPPKMLNNVEKIYGEANKVISACKEMLSDPQYCSEILAFIRNFSSFMNFVSCNNKYTTQLINDNFISFIIKNASQVPFAQKAILNFITYAASRKQEILKNSNVINFLILSLSSDFNQSLILLHASKKQDKIKFFQHQLMPKMFVILIQLLDKATNENRHIIMKFLRKIPSKQIKNMDSISDALMNNHSIILKKGDKTALFDCDSLIASIRMALNENIKNIFLWNFLINIIQSFAQIKNWNTDQHKYFYQILILFIHFNQKDPSIVKEQFNKIFQINHMIMKCHFLLAFCCEMSDLSSKLIKSIFNIVTDKNSFKLFISNLISIVEIMSYSTKIVLPKLCNCIIQNIDLDIIDEISFSILVHHTVIDSYSTEWIIEQHFDKSTIFDELNYLSDQSLELIKFCKERLSGKSISILPILNLIKLSTSLLPILVVVEMISKNENEAEIFQFLDEFLVNDVACYEYGDSRIIGPLSRAFPVILDKYYDKIASIIKDSTTNVSSMNNRKHQGLFLVILLPVLNSNKFTNIIDFEVIYNICNQFLTLQSPLLKCQAQQVYHALYKFGPDQIKMKILQHFEQITKLTNNKNNYLKWVTLIDTAFTYFPIFPQKVLSISLGDLDLIKQGILLANHQNTNPEEFFKTIASNLSFLSSGMVVQYMISQNLFIQTAKQLIYIYNQLTYFTKNEYLFKFFEKSGNEFPNFFNQTLNDEAIMSFFAMNISEPKMNELFNKYQSSINITDDAIKKNPIIILVILKTNMCEYFIQSIINVAHQMIDAYDKNTMAFKPVILKEIVIWFAQNRIEDFLSMSFQAFEVKSPLLTALFSQSAQTDINLDYFLNIKYSDNDEINFAFLEGFIFPLLQKHQEHLDAVIEFVHEKFSITIFLQFMNLLYSTRILTTKVKYDAFEIYQQCRTDEMQLQAILFWGYSGSAHFLEMFSIFASFFNIYLASEVRNVAEDLKIPPEFYGNDELCTIYSNLVKMFSRNPSILITVLTIYIKNREAFHKIDAKIWEYLQEQAICLVNPKKNMIHNYKMQFNYLIKILPTEGPFTSNENTLAQRIIQFANSIMTFSKEEEKIKIDTILKYRGGFLKGLLSLGKMFGSQCEFLNQLFSIIMELYPKTIQQNPLPNEIALFDLLMHSIPELIESLCQDDSFQLFDRFIDFIVENEKTMETVWTTSFLCLSYLSDSNFYREKVTQAFQKIEISNEFVNHAFPILWDNPPTEEFRISTLVPAVTNFCRSYNPEKPVDMLLSDSMLSSIFENPEDSSLFHILKECQECINANSDPGNRVFFSRVLIRALSAKRKDRFLSQKINKILEDIKVMPFFASNSSSINKELFDSFTLRTKFTFGVYFIDKFEDEINELIEKTKFQELNILSSTKAIPISVCLLSFFDEAKATEVARLVMKLSPQTIESLENQLKEPFESEEPLEILIKLGINSIEGVLPPINPQKAFEAAFNFVGNKNNLSSLSNWSLPKSPPSLSSAVYEILGLPEYAQKSLPSCLNDFDSNEVRRILKPNPIEPFQMRLDPHLESIYNVLCSDNQSTKYYAEKLSEILSRSNFFVTAESLPSLMIIQQAKYFVAVLSPSNSTKSSKSSNSGSNANSKGSATNNSSTKSSNKVAVELQKSSSSTIPSAFSNMGLKLFSYMLSPSFDPQLHDAYAQCREMMMDILTKASSQGNGSNIGTRFNQVYDEYEKKHIKNSKKSREYHFIEHYQSNLQSLVLYLDFQKLLKSVDENSNEQNENSKSELETTSLEIAKANVIKGLRFHKSSDVFLSAAYSLYNEIKESFIDIYIDDIKIPFKWSQIFSEIGSSELSLVVHPAFQCFFINEEKVITDTNVRNILAFLQNIESAIQTPELQRIKERYEMENKIVDSIRIENINNKRQIFIKPSENNENDFDSFYLEEKNENDEENKEYEVLPDKFIYDCSKLLDEDYENGIENDDKISIYIKSFSFNSIPPILYHLDDSHIVSVSLFLESVLTHRCTLKSLLASGFSIQYSIVPFKPMDARIGTFYDVIASSFFHRSPSNFSRSQKITSIPSIPLSNGFYLMQTTAEPFVQKSQLKNLLKIYNESHKRNENEERNEEDFIKASGFKFSFNYSSKKDFCNWFWHFSTRFAAISFIQIINSIAVFNPYQLMFDEKNASVALITDDVIRCKDDLCFFRFCGLVKNIFDESMVKGPFKFGFISAADCFTFNRDKFKFFSKTILQKEADEIDIELKCITNFSALDRPVDDVQNDLDSVIQKSSENMTLFSVPWI